MRAGVEFVARDHVHLQFGDKLTVVGESTALDRAARVLGDSLKVLDHPQLVPLFTGILVGVVFGSLPFAIPGMPAAVKLGLAGGPLVAALVLSRIGRVGPLNFYLPQSANLMLREMGIVLFLACVGLKAGPGFADAAFSAQGLNWMLCGLAITVLPLLAVALFARLVMKINYTALCGLMAGSMTDPPALAFANSASGGEGPAVTYATVYPLTMILRIVSAQALVFIMH
jgi:putative transport protein